MQSLKGELHDLRVALLMDIRQLKSQINEEGDASQPLKLASKALLGARKQPHKPPDANAGDYLTPKPTSCVKRIYRLPVNTFKYLVEGHLSQGLFPLRNLVLGRYSSFYQTMAWGPSREVTI